MGPGWTASEFLLIGFGSPIGDLGGGMLMGSDCGSTVWIGLENPLHG